MIDVYRSPCYPRWIDEKEVQSKDVSIWARFLKFVVFAKGSYWVLQDGQLRVRTHHLFNDEAGNNGPQKPELRLEE